MNTYSYRTKSLGLLSHLLLLALLTLLSTSLAIATERAAYPRILRGVWQGGHEPCKLPGNYDSDSRMEIKEHDIIGYEDSSIPLRIIQISKVPLAWKIKSRLDIYGDYSTQYEIFALSDKDWLVVIKNGVFHDYTRCK